MACVRFCFKQAVVVAALLLCAVPLVFGETPADVENLLKYNPDGQKYEFTKAFIKGLSYIYQNELKRAELPDAALADFGDKDVVTVYIQNLYNEKLNLRIARNLLNKYKTSSNGLIVKVSMLFEDACNEHIALNEKEIVLIENFHAGFADEEGAMSNRQMVSEKFALDSQRKEASKPLLSAAMLIQKVLISDKNEEDKELVFLGITGKEREDLLKRLMAFEGDAFEGGLREGQSFMQGSVVAIRSVLEDARWKTIK